jgi:hypothetical protein
VNNLPQGMLNMKNKNARQIKTWKNLFDKLPSFLFPPSLSPLV